MSTTAEIQSEWIVIIHGLGRSAFSMLPMVRHFRNLGYKVFNLNYPSLRQQIQQLAEQHLGNAIEHCRARGAIKIHLVTHSMGGIIARQYLQANRLPTGSRILMLSPPNGGSEIIDYLAGKPAIKPFIGPAAIQLHTEGLAIQLNPVSEDIGIITGSVSTDPWFEPLFNGPNDGKVSVKSAFLAEAKDFLVISCGHSLIMQKKSVWRQILNFLVEGEFVKTSMSAQST